MASHYLLNPRRSSGKRRCTRRKNPLPVLAVANPRRRRRRSWAVSRRARRNPNFKKMLSLRGVGAKDILFGASGMIVTKTFAPQVARMVKQEEFSIGGYAAKVAVAMLGGYAVAKFMSKKGGQSFTYGSLLVLAGDLWEHEVKPRIGLSGIGYYTPAATALPGGLNLPALPMGAFSARPIAQLPERLRAAY